MEEYPFDPESETYFEYECVDNETAVYNVYLDNECTELQSNETIKDISLFECDGTEDTFMELALFPDNICRGYERKTIFVADGVCAQFVPNIYAQLYCNHLYEDTFMFFYYFGDQFCAYDDRQTYVDQNECTDSNPMPFYTEIIQCWTANEIDTVPTQNPSKFPSQTPSEMVTIATTDTEDILSESETNMNSFDLSGYAVVVCCFALAFVLCVIVYFYHRNRIKKGTDAPAYLSIAKYFAGVVDFYTDVIWSLTLWNEQSRLFPYSCAFVFGPHILSLCVCVAYLTKWKQTRTNAHISNYAKTYDKVVILLSLIGGFYTATEIITSHIFHLDVLSLQISVRAKAQICTNLKIANLILFENIPCLVIQYLYLTQSQSSENFLNNGVSITLLAMAFGFIAVLFSVVTLVQRSLNACIEMARNRYESDSEQYQIRLDITLSNNALQFLSAVNLEKDGANDPRLTVQRFHIHSNKLISSAMVCVFDVQSSQIESVYVRWANDALKVNAKIKYLSKDKYDNIRAAVGLSAKKRLKSQFSQKLVLDRHLFDLSVEPQFTHNTNTEGEGENGNGNENENGNVSIELARKTD